MYFPEETWTSLLTNEELEMSEQPSGPEHGPEQEALHPPIKQTYLDLAQHIPEENSNPEFPH